MIYSKHIPKILSLVLVIFLGGILVAHANTISYTPLAPLPIGEGGAIPMGKDASGKLVPMYESMSAYLVGMMKLIIALGGVLAIVMAIIGGVQRIASGISPSAKADANKRVTDALTGLALVLASYLILNSINPNLVKINFDLPKLAGESREVRTSILSESEKQSLEMKTAGLLGDTSLMSDFPKDWRGGNDIKIREMLAKGGVGVNNSQRDCASVGDKGCTSLIELGDRAIYGLIKLASDCEKFNGNKSCGITITGGTEYWLHGNHKQKMGDNYTKHKPGNSVVDLSRTSSALNRYLVSDSNVLQKNEIKNKQEESVGIQYDLKGGGSYLDENIAGNPPHWHVTF